MNAGYVKHPVSDFIWGPPGPLGLEDLPMEGDLVPVLRKLRGHFAVHQVRPDGERWLIRDPVGVNKLFFAIGDDGSVHSSNYWIDLLRAGHSDVWSVPSGHMILIRPGERTLELKKYSALSFQETNELPLEKHGEEIRRRLDEAFRDIRAVVGERPVYVTLSGGLDSTTIAALARRGLKNVTAVTFAIQNTEAWQAAEAGNPGNQDVRFARRAAADLGIPLEVVTASPEHLLSLVDTALVYGQDFRDFNVHCAVVNAALGEAIGERHQEGARPVVLTGDTMNELMADYHPEEYQGRTYYPLPRLPPGRLRRYLVQGLDSGDREVGIFAHFGLDTIQPYALCADAYAAVSDEKVASPTAKQELVQHVMGEEVPEYIYARPKTRAQVGGDDEGMGVLGLFLDRGMDQAFLEHRFADVFGISPAEVKKSIRLGLYRSLSSYPNSLTPWPLTKS